MSSEFSSAISLVRRLSFAENDFLAEDIPLTEVHHCCLAPFVFGANLDRPAVDDKSHVTPVSSTKDDPVLGIASFSEEAGYDLSLLVIKVSTPGSMRFFQQIEVHTHTSNLLESRHK